MKVEVKIKHIDSAIIGHYRNGNNYFEISRLVSKPISYIKVTIEKYFNPWWG
jgi:hypothetical protein